MRTRKSSLAFLSAYVEVVPGFYAILPLLYSVQYSRTVLTPSKTRRQTNGKMKIREREHVNCAGTREQRDRRRERSRSSERHKHQTHKQRSSSSSRAIKQSRLFRKTQATPPLRLCILCIIHIVNTMTSPPADSDQIRSRLLNKLGIYDAQPPPSTAGLDGPGGGGSSLKPPTSRASPTTTKATRHQPILTAAQHRRLRILRGMGVGYTFQQYSPPDGSAIRPPLNGAAPRVEPLKGVGGDDDDDDDMMMNNHNHNISDEMKLSTTPDQEDEQDNNNNNNKKTTRIAFQDQVEVVNIPTRYEYSDRIRSRIWSNRHELQENAERNAVEFAAEVSSVGSAQTPPPPECPPALLLLLLINLL